MFVVNENNRSNSISEQVTLKRRKADYHQSIENFKPKLSMIVIQVVSAESTEARLNSVSVDLS